MSAFEKAFNLILFLEGGYNNDPKDNGGETKYGISKAAFPTLNIEKITIDDAKLIYKNQYWNQVNGNDLSPGIATMLFDFAVNAGVYQSKVTMQKVLKVVEDGIIGKKTLHALSKMREKDFLIKFTNERILFYTGLNNFDRFGRGWVNRSTHCLIACLTKGDSDV